MLLRNGKIYSMPIPTQRLKPVQAPPQEPPQAPPSQFAPINDWSHIINNIKNKNTQSEWKQIMNDMKQNQHQQHMKEKVEEIKVKEEKVEEIKVKEEKVEEEKAKETPPPPLQIIIPETPVETPESSPFPTIFENKKVIDLIAEKLKNFNEFVNDPINCTNKIFMNKIKLMHDVFQAIYKNKDVIFHIDNNKFKAFIPIAFKKSIELKQEVNNYCIQNNFKDEFIDEFLQLLEKISVLCKSETLSPPPPPLPPQKQTYNFKLKDSYLKCKCKCNFFKVGETSHV